MSGLVFACIAPHGSEVIAELAGEGAARMEITRRAIDFMRRSKRAGKPFYAYVPFTQVHYPTLPHPDFAGKTGHGDLFVTVRIVLPEAHDPALEELMRRWRDAQPYDPRKELG